MTPPRPLLNTLAQEHALLPSPVLPPFLTLPVVRSPAHAAAPSQLGERFISCQTTQSHASLGQ